MTLAEIVAEGERLHAEHEAASMWRSIGTAEKLVEFYSAHGPRLLAVAKAAVEAHGYLAVGEPDAAQTVLEGAGCAAAAPETK